MSHTLIVFIIYWMDGWLTKWKGIYPSHSTLASHLEAIRVSVPASPAHTFLTILRSNEPRNTLQDLMPARFVAQHKNKFVCATGFERLIVKHILTWNVNHGYSLIQFNFTCNHCRGLNTFCPFAQSYKSWYHFNSSDFHYKREMNWLTAPSLADRFPIRSHVHENSNSLGNGEEKRCVLTK
jgi:hypothetical protein